MTALHAFGGWLIGWLVLIVFYFLLAAKASWEEAIAAGVGAALAATAVLVTRQAGELHFRVRLSWLARLARLPWRILVDNGIVLAALGRRLILRHPVHGAFRIIPFDAGGEDATSAGRRALVVAGLSLAPNTYVIDIDEEAGHVLVHELVPSPQAASGRDNRELPL